MMQIHKHHDHCEHALKFCAQCDKPYCTKCGREWGFTWTQTTTWPQWQGTSTYYYLANTSGARGINTSTHTHS